jgi:hypothetical protein
LVTLSTAAMIPGRFVGVSQPWHATFFGRRTNAPHGNSLDLVEDRVGKRTG